MHAISCTRDSSDECECQAPVSHLTPASRPPPPYQHLFLFIFFFFVEEMLRCTGWLPRSIVRPTLDGSVKHIRPSCTSNFTNVFRGVNNTTMNTIIYNFKSSVAIKQTTTKVVWRGFDRINKHHFSMRVITVPRKINTEIKIAMSV